MPILPFPRMLTTPQAPAIYNILTPFFFLSIDCNGNLYYADEFSGGGTWAMTVMESLVVMGGGADGALMEQHLLFALIIIQ